MLDRKRQLIEELLRYLEESEGEELGAALNPPAPALEGGGEAPAVDVIPGQEAIVTEDVAAVPEPTTAEGGEMSDEELEELLKGI